MTCARRASFEAAKTGKDAFSRPVLRHYVSSHHETALWVKSFLPPARPARARRAVIEGEKTAEAFAQTMVDLGYDIDDVTEGLGEVNASTLDAIKAQFGGLIALVDLLTARVRDLRTEASGTPPESSMSVRNRAITDSGRERDAAAAQIRAFIAEQERQKKA